MGVLRLRNGIIKMGIEELCDINKPNQPFMVFGRLNPTYQDGQWLYGEELFATPYEKCFPDDELDYHSYVDADHKAVFLYYVDDQCVGQIILRRWWNAYCYVDDIAVSADHRRAGVGRQLMAMAIAWAKDHDFPGIMLEAQDINLSACRFYRQCGFMLGGVDTMLYRGLGNPTEKALFWYLLFS